MVDQLHYDLDGRLIPTRFPGTYSGVPLAVTIEGNALVATWYHQTVEAARRGDPPVGQPTAVPIDARTLLAFVNLAQPEAQPAHFQRFAQRWGVLNLCRRHGLPVTHPVSYRRWIGDGEGEESSPSCQTDLTALVTREPLAVWRRFAGQARTICEIAAELRQQCPGHRNLWQFLFAEFELHEPPWPQVPDLATERGQLMAFVNEWLLLGGVQPRVGWPPGETGPILGFTGGLFGGLAVQLMTTVSSTRGVVFCDACGAGWQPQKYTPRAGQRKYCPTCRANGTSSRDGARRRYQDKQAASGAPYRPYKRPKGV